MASVKPEYLLEPRDYHIVHIILTTPIFISRCQGASVASVKPEYLLEPRDYHLWKQMQKQLKMELEKQGEDTTGLPDDEEEELEEDVFELVSKRAWTDVLLQLLKVDSNALCLLHII